MPPFVPLADGAQVEIRFLFDGLVVEDRLWFVSRQPPVDDAQLGNLALGVFAWHSSQVMPLLSSDLTLRDVQATGWDSPGGSILVTLNPSVSGGNVSGSQSANVSYRVRFKGTNDTPRLYNANFVPGIPRDGVIQNTMDTSFVNALFEAYASLIDLAAVFGPFPAWRWVITSQIVDKAPRSEQLASRTDFVQTPSRYVSPRRRRIKRLKMMLFP